MIYVIIAYLLCGLSYASRDLGASPIDRPAWTHNQSGLLFYFMLVFNIFGWFIFRPRLYAFGHNSSLLRGYSSALGFLASVSIYIFVSFWLASHITNSFIIHLIISAILMFLFLLVLLPMFSYLMRSVEAPVFLNKQPITNNNSTKEKFLSEYGDLTRGFQNNKNKEDFLKWFHNNHAWKSLEQMIIITLIDRLKDNPKFEIFVHVSMKADLIKQYDSIKKNINNYEEYLRPAFICAEINKILFLTANSNFNRAYELFSTNQALKREDEFRKVHMIGVDALESTLIIDSDFFPAYLQLALLWQLVGKNDLAKMVCHQGLEKIEKLKKSPMMDSKVLNFKEGLREIENGLNDLLKTLNPINP